MKLENAIYMHTFPIPQTIIQLLILQKISFMLTLKTDGLCSMETANHLTLFFSKHMLKMNAVGIKIHFFIFNDLSHTKLLERVAFNRMKKRKEGVFLPQGTSILSNTVKSTEYS